MSYYPPNTVPLDDYPAAPAYQQGPPPFPQPRRGRTPAQDQSQAPPVAPYDNYGNQAFGQQDQWGVPPATQHSGAPVHDPFNGSHDPYNQQQQQHQAHNQQWAQPVHQSYDPASGGTGIHQLPPLHPDDSFVSQAPSDPFGNQHQHLQQTQDDDDDNGQAPLLAQQGAHNGHHPRWSSGGNGAPAPMGYGNGGAYTGGFNPNIVGPQGAGIDDDQQSVVRYGRIPQRQPRRYKTVKRE